MGYSEYFSTLINSNLKDFDKNEMFAKFFKNQELVEGINRYYLTSIENDMSIVFDTKLNVTSVQFFSGNQDDYAKFNHELMKNIDFDMSRDEIRTKFGNPDKSGEGYHHKILGYRPGWDKFYFDKYSLHMQYDDEFGSIKILTIASLKLEKNWS